ncbi:MAG: hypothetical protein JO322_09955 [Candidatus Eremiobacteraeota bacterium]|nr:hypothetical protein [Candidatus Eremiobacteraeota bacterium]
MMPGPGKSAPSTACQSLKSEISNDQTRLANEVQQQSNCENHLGTCSAGQIAGFQATIVALQEELTADRRRLTEVCALPPPPLPTIGVLDISPDAPFGQPGGNVDPGGQIDAIAVDPTNTNIVYAGGETSGVWKSSDGAKTWAFSSVGLEWGATINNGLAVDPNNPKRLLYATSSDDLGPGTSSTGWGGHAGLYVSIDAAQTWQHVTIPNCVPEYQHVIFGTSAAFAATYSCGILVSTDPNLQTWNSVTPDGITSFDDIAVSGNALFACTGTTVLRSPDGGTTWDPSSAQLPAGCYGLAAVPDNPGGFQFLAIVGIPAPLPTPIPPQPSGPTPSPTPTAFYQVGIGSTAAGTSGFAPLAPQSSATFPPGHCCGIPFVVAVKPSPQPANSSGPGNSYTVLASNAYQLFEYQAPTSSAADGWNLLNGIHVDIHGIGIVTSGTSPTCQIYVASDGGVFTNPAAVSGCNIASSGFVRAMHGLHAYGTFALAGISSASSPCGAPSEPCATVYAASDDNGNLVSTVSGAGATAWGDVGNNIGESGFAFIDPAAPGQFASSRTNIMYVSHSANGTPPVNPNTSFTMSPCTPTPPPTAAPTAQPTSCAPGASTQLLTPPLQRPVVPADYFAIRTVGGCPSQIMRNVTDNPNAWTIFGTAFPTCAVDLRVTNGHVDPYVLVLDANGNLWQGHVSGIRLPPNRLNSMWRQVMNGLSRVASFAVDPYDANYAYALDIGDPNSLADDSIKFTSNLLARQPVWNVDTALTKLAAAGGRYRLACGLGAPGAPVQGVNLGGYDYRYECALNDVVFVPGKPWLRFAVLSAGVAFTSDAGADWAILPGASPLARPVAAFYDPTVVPGSNNTDLYIGLRGHGVIRLRGYFSP